ncbi:MAG: TldD/PmbA family protein, partial [Chloroflexi bacterium]|nr:TldD/PmbA family protein [Chloroflexota bacterium]
IGTGNLIWEPGDRDPAEILAEVKDGLYLTGLMGFGVNPTTGDISKGAHGIWIEDGQLAYPVEEINVSGNLKDILRNIDAVGSDLEWRGGSATPTIRVSKMMVTGL